MLRSLTVVLFLFVALPVFSQQNIIVTNPDADKVLKGLYNPAVFAPGNVVDHSAVVSDLQASINADSLKKNIIKLASFQNRNTGSDTVSSTKGIGATRRWIYKEFESYSAQSGGRLIPSYLQFDEVLCNVNQHRNIFCILPGTDTTEKAVIFIEGHVDSRNKDLCDTAGLAMGVEDNATGTALVMELARVMSKHTYKRTIVFLVTISEEQGLNGANAFSKYCTDQKINVVAVQNNDVIGGVICGKTSSAPSCPGLNDIDSTQVRLFSASTNLSNHKNLCRYIKLQYEEELKPIVTVPMQITIMTAEDRTGRGGDHIPFRAAGFPSMRFTSANEHGDASNSTGYTDRQHTEDDILGVDTDADTEIDSFFVDFNYLARNAAINGTSAAMAAIGPKTPAFTLTQGADQKLIVTVTNQTQYMKYRVAFRTAGNDWDTVYTINTLSEAYTVEIGKNYYISVASVDDDNVESLFAREQRLSITGIGESIAPKYGIELLANKPNPFDESTAISFIAHKSFDYKEAFVTISDLQGRIIKKLPVNIVEGNNEIVYEHGYNTTGVFTYSLVIDGTVIDTKRMIFTGN